MKRILSVVLLVVMLLALAVPAAGALETYPITSDMPTIIVGLNTATIRPVNPGALGTSANIEYVASSKMVNISYEYESMTVGGITYPRVRVAKVTGYAPCTVTIEAQLAGLTLGSTVLTVRSSLASGTATVISTTEQIASFGGTAQLSVPGDTIVACSSSDPACATVSNSGLVTSTLYAGSGYTDITVYTASNKMGTIRIFCGSFATDAVAATKTQLQIGEMTQLFLLDGSAIAHTSSTNPSVAKVSTTGVVTGIGNGVCDIYVMSATKSGKITITVGTGAAAGGTTAAAATLTKNPINVGETAYLMAGSDVIKTCLSSNPAVATATNSGSVTGVSAGSALLTYTTYSGKTGTVTVTVGGAAAGTTDPSLPAPTQSFSTSVGKAKLLSMANLKKAWAADPTVASVSITGSGSSTKARVSGLKGGTTVIYLENTSGSIKALTVEVAQGSVIGASAKIASGDADLRVIVRKTASSSGKVLATLSNNVKVTIKGESGDYYQVSFKSGSKTYTGYVKKQFIGF